VAQKFVFAKTTRSIVTSADGAPNFKPVSFLTITGGGHGEAGE
jgi:hypothetical protein